MSKLTSGKRAKLPADTFALPDRRFPIPDKSHARAALSGATRAENAGNITKSQAAIVRAKANRKLGSGRGD